MPQASLRSAVRTEPGVRLGLGIMSAVLVDEATNAINVALLIAMAVALRSVYRH